MSKLEELVEKLGNTLCDDLCVNRNMADRGELTSEELEEFCSKCETSDLLEKIELEVGTEKRDHKEK